ncbi:calcium-binding protein [Albimonas pacifica]|uniref:Ca2+-binding protein, RTX toxin-related n=1 Tax=Albimonas pacifica TaxID=1114924 RepID=A0A1I3EHD6_9RHOB|nr:calcium-binding protein [Albimonas pacifica]SFH98121.1 Ca2+-binding protein, RTX toxin-related [Albimonas pacifica]
MATIWLDLVEVSSGEFGTRYSALLAGDLSPPPGSEFRIDWGDTGLPDDGGDDIFLGYRIEGIGVVQDYRGSTFAYPADVRVAATDSTIWFDAAVPGPLRLAGVPEAGGNTVHMGDGDDTVALDDTSTVYGGGGDDTMFTVDEAYGGDGNDRFRGAEQAYGGDGDDQFLGMSPGDVYGGAGFDEIVGGDRLNITLGRLEGVERINTYVELTLTSAATSFGPFSIDAYFEGVELLFDARTRVPELLFSDADLDILGPDAFKVPGYDDLRLLFGDGDNFFRGQDRVGGVERLTVEGGRNVDTMRGGAADETFVGNLGDDDLHGGGGDDDLQGRDGDDLLRGGQGEDRILGGIGADLIRGNRQVDALGGEGGNDLIYGGLGSDRLYGGADDDVAHGERGRDAIEGGEGADSLFGGRGSDSISGEGGDDLIRGDAHRDEITGGAGADSISGGAGRDTIQGDGDDDVLRGARGTDTIDGGAGDDAVHGGANDDLLFGGAGTNDLYGGRGEDVIHLEVGENTARGGEHADLFIVEMGAGADTILDFEVDLDRIQVLSGATSFEQLDITLRGDRTYVTYGLATDVVALVGVAPGDLDASDFLFGPA